MAGTQTRRTAHLALLELSYRLEELEEEGPLREQELWGREEHRVRLLPSVEDPEGTKDILPSSLKALLNTDVAVIICALPSPGDCFLCTLPPCFPLFLPPELCTCDFFQKTSSASWS